MSDQDDVTRHLRQMADDALLRAKQARQRREDYRLKWLLIYAWVVIFSAIFITWWRATL